MSDCRNPGARWPTLDIMRRVRQVDDTGLIPFVDTEAAARYLALSPHSLECYDPWAAGRPFTNSANSSATPFLTCKRGLLSGVTSEHQATTRAPIEACAVTRLTHLAVPGRPTAATYQ